MSQTTVNAAGMPAAIQGQLADSGPHDIVSAYSQEATAQIPFGVGLMKGSVAQAALLPSGVSGTMEIYGLNVYAPRMRAGAADAAGNFVGDLGASGLLPKAPIELGRAGRFWVPVEAAVRDGDRAYCRVTATGALNPGSWAGTNYGGSYVRDCTAQGVFRSATVTAADGSTLVAILECDFTNKPA